MAIAKRRLHHALQALAWRIAVAPKEGMAPLVVFNIKTFRVPQDPTRPVAETDLIEWLKEPRRSAASPERPSLGGAARAVDLAVGIRGLARDSRDGEEPRRPLEALIVPRGTNLPQLDERFRTHGTALTSGRNERAEPEPAV